MHYLFAKTATSFPIRTKVSVSGGKTYFQQPGAVAAAQPGLGGLALDHQNERTVPRQGKHLFINHIEGRLIDQTNVIPSCFSCSTASRQR